MTGQAAPVAAARAPARAGASFLAVALLAGCAAPQTAALLAADAGAGRRAILEVPFFPQQAYQCGPAALAMALAASGLPVTPEALREQVYLPGRQGSLQPEMLATARRHGRLAVVLPPELRSLLDEVDAGQPVVVLQNLALPLAPVWHYAVVIGYDLPAGEIVLHSGTTAAMRLPLPVFERTWQRAGHWAMVAVAPDRLPRSADDDALARAAAALERTHPDAARRSYAALAQRSPSHFGAWFGLGSTAVAAGDLDAARAALERATAIRPDNADAWNNLALVHLALGEAAAARAAAQRAVALGGMRLDRYLQTLRSVEPTEP